MMGLFKRLFKKTMEDKDKVSKKLSELNKNKDGPWYALNGFRSLTTVEINKNGEPPLFNPAYGAVLKMFINSETGELRVFPYSIFIQNND